MRAHLSALSPNLVHNFQILPQQASLLKNSQLSLVFSRTPSPRRRLIIWFAQRTSCSRSDSVTSLVFNHFPSQVFFTTSSCFFVLFVTYVYCVDGIQEFLADAYSWFHHLCVHSFLFLVLPLTVFMVHRFKPVLVAT